MPKPANEKLRDAAVRHRIYILRHEEEIYRALLREFLNELDADLVIGINERLAAGKLPDAFGGYTTRKMTALHSFVSAMVIEMETKLRASLSDSLAAEAEYEASWQTDAIKKSVDIDLDVTVPSPQTLEAIVTSSPMAGMMLKDMTAAWASTKVERVNQAIRLGLAEGQTAEQIVQRIAGTKARNYRDGLLEISRQGARMLVRTASNAVTTSAREILYRENKDIINSVVWVSTLDGRTSPQCRALDGKVFPIGEGPRPPAHRNCRSTTSPCVRSWKELGVNLNDIPEVQRPFVKDGLAGQVPASTTYQKWLSAQSAEFQDEILGPTRGKLFRAGGLTLDRFVDVETGHQWTLDELKRRESAAFAAAFKGKEPN